MDSYKLFFVSDTEDFMSRDRTAAEVAVLDARNAAAKEAKRVRFENFLLSKMPSGMNGM